MRSISESAVDVNKDRGPLIEIRKNSMIFKHAYSIKYIIVNNTNN